MFGIENSANNFGASAGLLAGLDSAKPVKAALGTIYFATDTVYIYRYNGTFWQLFAGGGQPFGGVSNGLSYVGGFYVGLGGTLVQNTQISGQNTYLIKFDDYTQFAIGNTNEPSMLFDDNNGKICTYYSGSIKGFDLDFINNIYQFGDLLFNTNGTTFIIDDGQQKIYTTNGGGSRGLELDINNGFYKLGDYIGLVNNTNIILDDGLQRINLQSGLGLYNFANIPVYANNAAALAGGLIVGDIYRHSGGTGEQLHIVF